MLFKLDVSLTLAFQNSEGPFQVLVKINSQNASLIPAVLSKEEILNLAQDEVISNITLDKRAAENRRWRDRSSSKNRRSAYVPGKMKIVETIPPGAVAFKKK